MFELIVLFATALGYPNADRNILRAIDAACSAKVDAERCAADAAVYAALESGFRENPRAYSWDARGGVSCGFLQQPCGFVRSASLEHQAERWVAQRTWSLRACGSLAGLASGSCLRGTRLARERASIAEDVLFGGRFSEER